MKRETYLKGLHTRSNKMSPEKAFSEIWLRLTAVYLASPERAIDLIQEAQHIASAKMGEQP